MRFENVTAWDQVYSPEEQKRFLDLVETGQVLLFPNLPFAVQEAERILLSPKTSDGKSKNVAYDGGSGDVFGTTLQGNERQVLRSFMRRFTEGARSLIEHLFPRYVPYLAPRLASFRPVAVEGRNTSSKKDDTRLHVDAFASRPNQGRRILRVFSNANPHNQPRTWLVGEAFEPYAKRFLPSVRPQWPLEAPILKALHVTKSTRTPYDHAMLGLHDHGKLDDEYQATAPRERVDFPAGSTWVCFTDQVLHAALGGQFLLEQTFFLPVAGMGDAQRSPLRVLERLAGRSLA